jgi:hypothetical protein
MKWTPSSILAELRRLQKSGAPMHYRALASTNHSLLSAAVYHHGSYSNAIRAAGIDYESIIGRPRWTKDRVIRVIKDARRKNKALNWGAVSKSTGELSRAAFAAIGPRLFGSWERALQAAGIDGDDVRVYRAWSDETVAWELRHRHADGLEMNSGAVQRDDSSLHSAALRYFGTYDRALRAAKLEPGKVRIRSKRKSSKRS